LIRNRINGKGYVGQTIQTMRKRWSLHKSEARRGTDFAICRAIRKHGAENFSIEVLTRGNKRKLNDLERKFIRDLDTHLDNGRGYNADGGGQADRGALAKATRHKMRAIQMRRWENNPVLRAQWGVAVKALRAAHPEISLAQSASMKALFASHPEMLRKRSRKMRKYHAAHPELGSEHSDYMKAIWGNKGLHAARVAGQKATQRTQREHQGTPNA
jgi:group I intron endonuclease